MLTLCFSMSLAQTPYAILDNGTLTFYYDNDKDSRTGTAYDVMNLSGNGRNSLFTSKVDETDGKVVTPYQETTKAVFDNSFAEFNGYNDMGGLFYMYSNLTEIRGIENLHTENVTNMGAMFYGCSSLTSLDLSNFNTENVKEMYSMFNQCTGLKYLNISSFSRASLTNATAMFNECSEYMQLVTPKDWYIDDIVVTETNVIVGNYIYTLYQDHHADMEGIVNTLSGDVVVPAIFVYEGDTYSVKKVNSLSRLYYFDEDVQRIIAVQGDNRSYLDTAPDFSLVTSLTFGDGIESISDDYLYVYYHCKSVNIPKSVTYISPETYYMKNLSGSGYIDETRGQGFSSAAGQVIFNDITYNVDPANTVYASVDGALYDKEMKTLLRCPKGKEGVFVVPDGVEIIDRFAFLHCLLLTEVQLPASVKVLGDDGGEQYANTARLFSHCYSLEKVNIPEGVERLESMSFRYCTNLKGLTIPNTLQYYNTSALSGNAESLEYLDWQDCVLETLEIYDRNSILVNTSTKCLISLPKSVKNIICTDYYGYTSSGGTLFSGGIVPEELTLPASIEKFEATRLFSTAFNSEKLASLKKLYVLMDKMPDIDEACFGYDEVTVMVGNRPRKTQSFPQTWADQCTLYVPENLVEAYKTHAVWGKFPNIVGVEVTREIEPIEEETAIAFEESNFVNTDNTPVDLNNTIVNDTYFSINNTGDAENPEGFYDATEQCIVINKVTSNAEMSTVVASKLGSTDVVSNFTGMVIEVNGKGSIKINAQTIGNSMVAVKIGNGDAKTFAQTTKGDIIVNYDVAENTYIYIYATNEASQQQSLNMSTTANVAENAVKIYSVTVMPDVTAIESVASVISTTAFGKRYSIDGKHLSTPQKGINILKMSDGTMRKVLK